MVMGRPVARADSGVGVVACWVDDLGQPCVDDGYTKISHWQEIVRLAIVQPRRRPPLGSSPVEDVVRACLAWDPVRRASMRRVCQMPWLTQAGAEPCQQPSQARASTPAEPCQQPSQASASTPAPGTGPGPCLDACDWGPEVIKILGERSPPARASPQGDFGTCLCAGNCRNYQHRRAGRGCCDRPVLEMGAKYCQECVCAAWPLAAALEAVRPTFVSSTGEPSMLRRSR